jgi:hypothetical protein
MQSGKGILLCVSPVRRPEQSKWPNMSGICGMPVGAGPWWELKAMLKDLAGICECGWPEFQGEMGQEIGRTTLKIH